MEDEVEETKRKEKKRQLGRLQVLVPGAGLGRLAFEIARRGFNCQGNEFSLFMLFASNFVLNKCVVFTEFFFFLPGFPALLPHFTGFYRVLLGFIGSNRA